MTMTNILIIKQNRIFTRSYWQGLILSTQETEERIMSQQEVEQVQQQHQHQEQQQTQREKELKKKPKSRGNRQLQRFRAKLRKQGWNNETIATLITDYNNPFQENDNEREGTLALDVNVQDFIELQDQVE